MTNVKTKQEILQVLNEQQKAPVLDYLGPSAVTAGPGSGKTKMLVSRCAYMIQDGVLPSNIVLFTFTKKAANEIKERLSKEIGNDLSEAVTVSTYHSFCGKLLRKYATKIGWRTNYSIYDNEDKKKVIKSIIQDNKQFNFNNEKSKSLLCRCISSFKEKMISPQMAINNADTKMKENIALFYEKYNARLKEQNAFDFDDLIYYVIRLFERFPSVLEMVNNRYKFILADEIQDSSLRDLTLIKYLGGKTMNICCIGDDDQSIYSFRGVRINAYYDFIKENNLKRFVLGRNYRSTKTIVDASQSMINKNEQRLDKKIYTENKDGSKISFVTLKESSDEANYVAKIIKASLKKGYTYNDIAILYRISSLSRSVEKVLFSNNIPYAITGGCAFFERIEVKDIISYLRFIYNPADLVALERIVNTPKRGIGEKTLEKIIKSCQCLAEHDTIGLDALKEIKLGNGTRSKGLKNFISVIEQLKEFKQNGSSVIDLIGHILNLTNYNDYLMALEDNNENKVNERLANIEELQKIAFKYSNLEEFLNAVSLYEENAVQNEINNEDNESKEKVSLMTIHASKGLEFPVIIIIGANQTIIPHKLSIKEDNIDEERRLFYVAMTRAKEELFITRAKIGFSNYGLINYRPTQFINEINPAFLIKR